jgi:predicted RNA binding protein YcfA (HicA-like mRNA interferase family)
MKVKEIIKIVEADGWYLERQKGSHRQYKHIVKKGVVTIPVHKLSGDLPIGTEKAILKQAQIDI